MLSDADCVMAASCGGCQEMSSVSDFECGWCPDLQRCSDGVDRFRQEWFTSGCLDTVSPLHLIYNTMFTQTLLVVACVLAYVCMWQLCVGDRWTLLRC